MWDRYIKRKKRKLKDVSSLIYSWEVVPRPFSQTRKMRVLKSKISIGRSFRTLIQNIAGAIDFAIYGEQGWWF